MSETSQTVAAVCDRRNEIETGGQRPPLQFEIPHSDLREFAGLPDKVRDEITDKLHVLALASAKGANKQQLFREHARPANGWSPKSLCRLYYEFTGGARGMAAGDWRILRNNLKAGSLFWKTREVVGFEPEFVAFVKMLFERNQRVNSAAYRELLDIWQTRQMRDAKGNLRQLAQLPGYDGWPLADRKTGLPRGWSETNIYRACKLTNFEKLAARQGRMKASTCRLPVKTTRVGLALGERIEFDDHEFDLLVAMPGLKQLQRPRTFMALDVFSGSPFAACFKPTLWDADEEKKKTLTERDFMWFVVSILTEYGFRDDARGTTLVVEHGTSAIRPEFEKRIEAATRGRVKIFRGGIVRRAAHGGQFEGRAKGNFRAKPHIEGFWNGLNNELAALAGQVGKDREHAPEGVEASRRYQEKLMKAALENPALVQRLQWPFLTFGEFVQRALDAVARIDTATEHDLEGWAKLGFFKAGSGEQGAGSVMRRLSRREVWQQHKHELTPLPPETWPLLLGEGFGRPVRVLDNGIIAFDDARMDDDKIEFVARIGDERLPAGERFLGFCNPFAAARKLVVCDAKMRVVGVCPEYVKPCANDADGVNRLLGAQAHDEARQLAPLQQRHAAEAAERTAMIEHNEAILEGRFKTDAELAADEHLSRSRLSKSDLEAATGRAEREEETGKGQEVSAEEISELLKT